MADFDIAAEIYCEDPEQFMELLSVAKKAGLKEMVEKAEDRLKDVKYPTVMKKPESGTEEPPLDDTGEYNNYYYCDTENTTKCELCWVDDNENEACCYKSTDQVTNGDDHCGSKDVKFDPSKKSYKPE